jgi:hypothetical protein
VSQKVRRIFIGLEKYVKEQTDAAAFRVLVGPPQNQRLNSCKAP